MKDLTGLHVTFNLRNKKVLGIVKSHDMDKDSILLFDMVNIADMQPVKGRFGGLQISASSATVITF